MPNEADLDHIPPEDMCRTYRTIIRYDDILEEVRRIVRDEIEALEARLVRGPDKNGVTASAGKG